MNNIVSRITKAIEDAMLNSTDVRMNVRLGSEAWTELNKDEAWLACTKNGFNFHGLDITLDKKLSPMQIIIG